MHENIDYTHVQQWSTPITGQKPKKVRISVMDITPEKFKSYEQ